MKISQDHIINRQTLEISFSSRTEAMQNRDEISRIYRRDLLPLIAEIFDEAVDADVHVRIERLDIDLGRISPGNMKDQMVESLRKKLLEELSKAMQNATVALTDGPKNSVSTPMATNTQRQSAQPEKDAASRMSSRQSNLGLFVYFVENGRLPWWAGKGHLKNFEELAITLLQQQPRALEAVIRELIRHSNYVHRLIHQLPDRVLVNLIDLLQPQTGDALYKLHADFYSIHHHRQLIPLNDTGFRLICWQCAFQFCTGVSQSSPHLEDEKSVQKVKGTSLHEYVAFLITVLSDYRQPDVTENKAGKLKVLTDQIIANIADLSRKKYPFRTRSIRKIVAMEGFTHPRRTTIGKQNPDASDDLSRDGKFSGTTTEKKKRNAPPLPDEGHVEIHNAGLVLLWPFLPALFEGIGLTEGRLFVTEDAAGRAALLLQYAVTKDTQMPEYELTLNKVLCGIDIDEPLPSTLTLSAAEEEEIENLLDTVAHRWEALKGTSGEGLRRTFLTKDGILTKHVNGWNLTVERSAVDMLLDKLPWSISIIKLPWCKQMLYVEW